MSFKRGTIENYVRIPFETKKIDFKQWKLYLDLGSKNGKAAVFLNGQPLAWAEGGGKFLTLDLAAVPAGKRVQLPWMDIFTGKTARAGIKGHGFQTPLKTALPKAAAPCAIYARVAE